MEAQIVRSEIPASELNKQSKAIFEALDKYINAMKTNQGRYPSSAYINRKQAATIQNALNALAQRAGQKEALKLADLTYRGLPFVVV